MQIAKCKMQISNWNARSCCISFCRAAQFLLSAQHSRLAGPSTAGAFES
jgi:hypothetical protein